MRIALQQKRTRGITLIECLVYVGVFAVIFGLGVGAFFKCIETSHALQRNSDDIKNALMAGERWRADIRAATKPIQFDAENQTLRIQHDSNEVTYKFSEDQITRRSAVDGNWIVVLSRVDKSQMKADRRNLVTAWQWELELKTLRKMPAITPIFTFTAVPVAISQP